MVRISCKAENPAALTLPMSGEVGSAEVGPGFSICKAAR